MRASLRFGFHPLLLVLVASACSDPITVEEVREPFDPPLVYVQFWEAMEVCTSIVGGGPAQVRWFLTDWFPGQPGVLGQWNDRHEITLLRDARFDKGVVMHEMVHEMLRGDTDHKDAAWTNCQEAGLVMRTERQTIASHRLSEGGY